MDRIEDSLKNRCSVGRATSIEGLGRAPYSCEACNTAESEDFGIARR